MTLMTSNKLALALAAIKKLQDKGHTVFKGQSIKREHQEILKANGFLKEIIKGWYYYSPLNDTAGESTVWNATWKDFIATYSNDRFKKDWYLSPEQSLLIHARSTSALQQIIIHSKKGSNNITQLLNNASMMDYKTPVFLTKYITIKDGLNVLTPEASLLYVSETFFRNFADDAQIVLSFSDNMSEMIEILLEDRKPVVAGRITGALRVVGREDEANLIVRMMKLAGYTITENNPFQTHTVKQVTSTRESAFAARLTLMWSAMREDVLAVFPEEPGLPRSVSTYVKNIQDKYAQDAYHSLSIEGYQVTEDLIRKIAANEWNATMDKDTRNAFAAKGYHLAFEAVKDSVKKIIEGENAAQTIQNHHQLWYLQLFTPSITAGIIAAKDVAGYRNAPVFIRESDHIPPDAMDARNGMYAYFELLKQEPSAAVRAVLGHFLFVYIHPYLDGNGRMGRFIMNALLASGGYSWTIVPVDRRAEYMAALETASVQKNIRPFAEFIASCVQVQDS